MWMMFCRWTFLDSVIIYLHRIYPNELKAKDTTDTQKYAFYLDNGKRWNIKLLNKRNDTFPIVHFPFISSNITTSSAYWVSKVILEVVPSTVMFCTDLSCSRKSYSHNIFDRTHYNNSTCCVYCHSMCLYVLSFVLWCLHENDVRFAFTSCCL